MLEQFISFASLSKMSEVGSALVCSECLGDATRPSCLRGECERCGFSRLWSRGLRKHIKGDDAFWGQQIFGTQSSLVTMEQYIWQCRG